MFGAVEGVEFRGAEGGIRGRPVEPQWMLGRLRNAAAGAEEGAEEVAWVIKARPQRLKPVGFCGVYGTDKSVPLSKAGFFCSL